MLMFTSLIATRLFLANLLAVESGDLGSVGTYYVLLFAAIAIIFLLGGKRCREKSFLPFFRLGITLHIFFWGGVTILFQSDLLVPALPLVAVVHGIAQGFFWLPFVQYGIDFSTPMRRAKFYAGLYMASQIISVIVPVTLGTMVASKLGYEGVFITLMCLFIAGSAASFIFLTPAEGNRPRYHFMDLIRAAIKFRDLRRVYFAIWMMGLTVWGAMELLTPLLVYRITGSAVKLGLVASALPFIEMTTCYLVGKVNHTAHRSIALVSGTILLLTSLLLASAWSLWAVIVFAASFSLTVPALGIIANTFGANVVSHHRLIEARQTEFIVVRELVLTFGRFIGYSLFAYLGGTDSLRALILFLGVCVFFLALTLRSLKFEQDLSEQDVNVPQPHL